MAVLLIESTASGLGEEGIFPADDGAFGFVHAFENTVVKRRIEERIEEAGLAVYAADVVNVGNVYGDQVSPTVHKKAIAGYAEIADRGNLPKGDGYRVGWISHIENMNALALFDHKEEAVTQKNTAA